MITNSLSKKDLIYVKDLYAFYCGDHESILEHIRRNSSISLSLVRNELNVLDKEYLDVVCGPYGFEHFKAMKEGGN